VGSCLAGNKAFSRLEYHRGFDLIQLQRFLFLAPLRLVVELAVNALLQE
jgi:hypothetical protein